MMVHQIPVATEALEQVGCHRLRFDRLSSEYLGYLLNEHDVGKVAVHFGAEDFGIDLDVGGIAKDLFPGKTNSSPTAQCPAAGMNTKAPRTLRPDPIHRLDIFFLESTIESLICGQDCLCCHQYTDVRQIPVQQSSLSLAV